MVHPPLYHLAGTAVNTAAGNASILTRVTWVRFLTALFGVLAVYAAWLLAAQVLRNTRLQLLAAFLVAVQPMCAYLAGIVNHDSALFAFTTLALAMMAFMLRSPPRAAQGAWLGGAIVLALFVKGSALALLPWPRWPTCSSGSHTATAAARCSARLASPLDSCWCSLAGGTCARAIVYGSATGATTPITGGAGAAAAPAGASLSDLVDWAREWTGLTYRTYWFHFRRCRARARRSGSTCPSASARSARSGSSGSRGARAARSCAPRAC